MTVQPGRKLEGLTFDQVEAEVKREYELVEKGEEFQDNLSHIRVFRWNTGCDPVLQTARDWLDLPFTRDDYRADDWVFHDTTKVPLTETETAALFVNEKRTFSRDDIHTAVSLVMGRFYYSNPDTHKIVPEILKRLGFE